MILVLLVGLLHRMVWGKSLAVDVWEKESPAYAGLSFCMKLLNAGIKRLEIRFVVKYRPTQCYFGVVFAEFSFSIGISMLAPFQKKVCTPYQW